MDPEWLVTVEKEIEATAKVSKKPVTQVTMTADMHSIISQFAYWNTNARPNSASLRNITSNKKRKRSVANREWNLMANINVSNDARARCRTLRNSCDG